MGRLGCAGLVGLLLAAWWLPQAPAAAAEPTGCSADPAGDVVEAGSGDPAAVDQADLLEVCAHPTDDDLVLAMRVARPELPVVGQPGTAFEWFLDEDGVAGGGFRVTVSHGAGSGELGLGVTDEADQAVCQVTILPQAGATTSFSGRIPRSCVGDPASVHIGARITWAERDGEPAAVDEAAGGDAPEHLVALPVAPPVCVEDDPGDVTSAGAAPDAADEPDDADLIVACADWTPTALQLTAELVSPPSDGGSRQQQLHVAWELDVDGDGMRDWRVVRVVDESSGVETANVVDVGDDLACDSLSLAVVDGVIAATVPWRCVPTSGAPSLQVRAVVTTSDAAELEDRAPDGGGFGPPLARHDGPAFVPLYRSLDASATVAMSRATFPQAGARTALLTRGDEFADALASGPIQGVLNAPLLTTARDALDEDVAHELDRLRVQHVVVLGGEEVVGAGVVADVEATGRTVERVFGATRLETAVALRERFLPLFEPVLLARAYAAPDAADETQEFADSLAVGAWGAAEGQLEGAAYHGRAVLLTQTEVLSTSTRQELDDGPVPTRHATVIGGDAAISPQVVTDLEAIGYDALRVGGANRFGTAVEIASARGMSNAAAAERVILVEGQEPWAWQPGFAAAAYAAMVPGTAVVLANGAAVPPETAGWLTDVPSTDPPELVCAPGTSYDACREAYRLLTPE